MTNFSKGKRQEPPGSNISQFHSVLIVTFNVNESGLKLIKIFDQYFTNAPKGITDTIKQGSSLLFSLNYDLQKG